MIGIAFILLFNLVLVSLLHITFIKYKSLDKYCQDMIKFYEEELKKLKEEKF